MAISAEYRSKFSAFHRSYEWNILKTGWKKPKTNTQNVLKYNIPLFDEIHELINYPSINYIPHATSCGGYDVFDPSASQSVRESCQRNSSETACYYGTPELSYVIVFIMCYGFVIICCGSVIICSGFVIICCGSVIICSGFVIICCGLVIICCGFVIICCGFVIICCGSVIIRFFLMITLFYYDNSSLLWSLFFIMITFLKITLLYYDDYSLLWWGKISGSSVPVCMHL